MNIKRIIKSLIVLLVFSLYLLYMAKSYLGYKNKKALLVNQDKEVEELLIKDESTEALISDINAEVKEVDNIDYENKDKVLYSKNTNYDLYLSEGKKLIIDKYIQKSTKSDIKSIDDKLDNDKSLSNTNLIEFSEISHRDFDIDKISFERKILLKNMIDIYNNFRSMSYKKNTEIYSDDDYQVLLEKFMFNGDSQVGVMKAYNKNLRAFMHSIGGNSIKKQYDDIDTILNEDLQVIIFFNGYNIGKYNNQDEYIEDYKKIIGKIHNYNKDIKIFITSLLPAREDVVLEDLKYEISKYYNGPVFDKALKETFNDIEEAVYIDTNWMLIPRFYDSVDGVHFVPEFYWAYIPYVVSYVYFTLFD